MKISKEVLKQIIKEELEQKAFGTDSSSQSDRKKSLTQKYRGVSKEKGIDNKERGIVERIEQNLTKLAALSDLKSGPSFALLKRLNSLMEKEINRLEGGKKDEK